MLRAFQVLRRAVVATTVDGELLLRGEVEADESYFGGRRKGRRGRGAAGRVPVFGILERRGVVKVGVVPNVRAETLLNRTVQLVRRGSIVYTDKFRSYDALMFCGYRHLRVDHGQRVARGKVCINGLSGVLELRQGATHQASWRLAALFPLPSEGDGVSLQSQNSEHLRCTRRFTVSTSGGSLIITIFFDLT